MLSKNSALNKILGDFNDFLSATKSSDSNLSNFDNTNSFSGNINFSRSNMSEEETLFFSKECSDGLKKMNSSSSSHRSNKDLMDSHQKTVDLVCAKNTISKLESKIETLELARKRSRIEYESEKDLNELDKKNFKAKAEDLQREVVRLMEKQVEILDELNKCKQNASNDKLAFEEKLRKLQNENISTVNKCNEDLSLAQETISELKSTIFKNERLMSEVKLKNDMLSKKLQIKTNNLEEALNKLQEYQKFQEMCSELSNKVKMLEDTLSQQEDFVAMNKILHSEVNSLKEAEKENKKLKEENRLLREERENILLLQEKIDGLDKALERSEKRCLKVNELQIKNEELTAKLKQWESLDCTSNEKSPRKVAQSIAELQSKEALTFNRCSELETQVKVLMKTNKEITNKLLNVEEELKLKTVKLQLSGDNVKRLQKKLLLVTKERDSFQHLLNSYEKEITMNSSMIINEKIQMLENVADVRQKQVSALEEELKTLNEKLLEKLDPKQLASGIAASEEKLKSLEERNSSLENQVKLLEDSNKKLGEEKESLELRLEYRALKGDYDPISTKVVHMKFNPASTAQTKCETELEILRKENQQLLERIRIISQSPGSDSSLNVSDKNEQNHNLSYNKEIDELKKQLKKAELRHQRFMEAFSEKSQEFREVCYMLFGYRVDMTSERQYKLISMYAEKVEDFFLFKLNNGELQLLETAFSHQVSYLIETHLQMQHSIPAFLSNVTLELFSQQTFFVPIPSVRHN